MTNETQMTEATENPELQDVTEAQEVEVPFDVPEGFRLITDEEAELLASQLVESRQEKWEVQEIVDNAVAAGEMNAMMRNEFLYEFKQGGRDIRGLTAAMIAHLATAQGASEVTEEREHVETDEKHEFTVVVEMPSPVNPNEKVKRTGFCEEPKNAFGKYDKFAKQKAYTKAFRNACMKLLPQDLVIATIYKLARLVPGDWQPRQALPPQRQQRALPPATNGNGNQQDTATLKAMNACFATFNEKEQDLADLGVSKADFWEALKGVLGVQSRDDMTEKQWNAVNESLKTVDFGEIVRDVLVKCDVNLADLETQERF